MNTSDIVILREDDSEFSELKFIIKREIGFNCEQYKQAHLKRRLAVRLRATQSKCYKEYADILLKNPDEQKQLKETLTVNVTELFRNPETYEAFHATALPELIKSRGENRNLKVWSAGCSNGEEPYSIAIMLIEYLGILARRYNISILGTDIDEDSLSKAGLGIFHPKALEKISKERLDRFFIKKYNNYQVTDEIHRMVTFKNHDLISGPKLSGFDIIFCRNVTIYFEQKLQEKLYLDFYNAMKDGGYFVMGKTETLIGQSSRLFKHVDLKERIYQKKVN